MGMNKQSLFKVSKLSNACHLTTPKSDWHLFSPYKITRDSNIKVTRIREMIDKKKLLIVKQILFFRTLRNV